MQSTDKLINLRYFSFVILFTFKEVIQNVFHLSIVRLKQCRRPAGFVCIKQSAASIYPDIRNTDSSLIFE